MPINTVNPATGSIIKTYSEMSLQETQQILELTHQDYLKWRKIDLATRSIHTRKMAEKLKQNKNQYAKLMAEEMGKPITQGIGEIEKCAWVCEYYADNAHEYLKPRIVPTEMAKSYVTYQPLGIIFAIMPWNFPFWQVFRFAVPSIMAGNGAVLKHAPISTGTGLAIENLFQEAGFPDNLFRTLIIDNDVAAQVIDNNLVAAVTLTGSTRAGQIVGANAAKALKPTVLELGGSDPYLILEDADLEKAAEACVISRMNNSGQVCIAAKRIIILQNVKNKFIEILEEKLKRYQMGDPMDLATNFGPLAREDIRDGVHQQVQASVKKGAELRLGGKIPERKGFYYPPTLLNNVKPDMPAYEEEIFGPVISIITVRNEIEAINIANSTKYGLGAAIFTQDLARGEKIAAEEIQAGTCAINTWVSSDPRLPFGGIKQSGYGRELSAEGIRSFTNVKTIHIK